MDHFLKGGQEAWEIFTDSLASSDRITYEQDCELTRIRGENTGNSGLKVYPVPFNEYLNIEGDIEVRHLEIFDLFGRKINKYSLSGCQHTMINTSDLQPGFYQFLFTGPDGERTGLKAIKL